MDTMQKIKAYISKYKKIKEQRFFISAQNRGFKLLLAGSNPAKPNLNGRSMSDNYLICKLIALYLAIFSTKNRSKSKLFGGYCLEAF
jgi:hypothetical protein